MEALILKTGGVGFLPTLENGLSEAHSAFLAPKSQPVVGLELH